MRIQLTLTGPDGPCDVLVEASDAVAVGVLAPRLAALVGATADAGLWCDGERIDPASTLGASGLRAGSVCAVGCPDAPPAAPGLLELHVVGGATTGPPLPLRRGRITIGRDPTCDVTLDDDRASRRHAALEVDAAGVLVRDLGSTNGTGVDGVGLGPDGTALQPGEVVRIGDSLLTTTGPVTAARTSPGPDATLVVNRPPRARPDLRARTVDLPVAAAPPCPGRVQWLTALVPVIGGVAVAWVLSAPQLLLLALLSPVMMVSGALGDRVHWRRARRRAAVDLRRRLATAEHEIADGLRAETARRRHEAPDPGTVLRTATGPGVRLWERRPGDADLLVVRVGSAELPSRLRISSGGVERPAGALSCVPATVDLRAGPIGAAGPDAVVSEVVRWWVGQLVALHGPGLLDLVLVVDPDRVSRWRWTRWLPHLRTPAAGPDDPAPATAGLLARLERRQAAGSWTGPWVLVVVDVARPAEVPGLGTVLLDGPALGMTAVCAADDVRALPDTCATAAVAEGTTGCRLSLRSSEQTVEVLADRVDEHWATMLARALAPLVDPDAAGADLPARVRLAELVPTAEIGPSTEALLRSWAAAGRGARTAVGVASDGPVVLDLVEDGPHALVAGTTGAGKSELLRTLVAGLAVAHPPDALSLLLVDYKGGAAFADCARLPHTVGLVTDLDAQLTVRALRSLHAELRRRERLFERDRVNDFAAYRGTEPLARLVIVVDEFAELAAELPEFVTGLIGVARRGRSLGVHLVLATQRPGSSVSPEIRANTSLRIALRVTDVGDSRDVIDAPDAASIDPSRPGRAFVRTGRGLTAMQTATVARTPRTHGDPVVRPVPGWGAEAAPVQDAGDELTALVDLIGRAAVAGAITPARRPWRPPLPRSIPLSSLADVGPSLGIGVLDAPDEQAQPTLTLDPDRDTAVLVAGRPGSGRTQALLTIAVAHTTVRGPDLLHVHVIDGGGVLADLLAPLPHLGTVITPSSADLVTVLLDRLITGAGRDGAPRTLVLIDDWDRLLADRDDLRAAEWSDLLSRLLRSAAGSVTVVLGGGRSLLAPRTAGAFGVRLLLELADPGDHALMGLAARDVPTATGPGRGVRADDAALFQLAHPGSEPGPSCARDVVGSLARRWSGVPPRRSPVRLRPLPELVTLASVRAAAADTAGVLLGRAGDTAEPCAVDLLGPRTRLLVAGPPRSGRSTTLRTVLAEAMRLAHPVLVLAPPHSPLLADARRGADRCGDVRILDPASLPARPPAGAVLLLVDDDDAFAHTAVAERLVDWLRDPSAVRSAVVAARSDDLATTYRGPAAEVRRSRCGVLLRPGPIDGELLGLAPVRPGSPTGPAGRGLLVGEPSWGRAFTSGDAVPIQVATPDGGSE